MLGKNNKIRDFKANTVVHYKSYKDGKRWVFTGLAALSMGAGIFFGGLNYTAYAKVDDSVNQTQQADNATAKSTAATNRGNQVALSSQAQITNDVSTTNVTKTPVTKEAQTDSSTLTDNTHPATSQVSAEPTKATETPTGEDVPTKTPASEPAPTTNRAAQNVADDTPDVTNLGEVNDDHITAAKATAAATYQATGKPQEITASLDNVAPSVQLGNTTLTTTGENDVSLNYGSATKAPTILVTGNATTGDTLKIDLPPIYSVQSYDTDFNGTKNSASSVSYSFAQNTAYTLHIYTKIAQDGSVSMDTDGTTPMNLTVTKSGTATVYPLKVTSSPIISSNVAIYNTYNGQNYTLNLANAVNGVIPNVTLSVNANTNSNFLPKITSGSYSIDVPKGFVAGTSNNNSVTITQPGGAGTPVTLTYANATYPTVSIMGSINVTNQTTGSEQFGKTNTSGTLQTGTHSVLPVSISYRPLTYVNIAAISQPQNYVTSYAGNTTWPKFDNDTYNDIGLYSVVTGGQSAMATTDQVTFNVPDGVIATKVTTPSYAANVTVTLKSGKQVQYNNIAGSVITGTVTDPIVSVTSKSIDKQTYPIGPKQNQSDYSSITSTSSKNNRFFISGYLTNATVGNSYTVTASNDDADAPQSDSAKFTVANYGVVQYSGYSNRTSTSTSDNGIRYHSGDTIKNSYNFSISQGKSINGPATATYYVIVPTNAVLKSLNDITVTTSGSQTAIKEVLPQTLNGQEIVKISVTNPERTALPGVALNYQVSPTAKLGTTVNLDTDSAGSGRFIMAGDFQPASYVRSASSTTTLKDFASLVGDTSSNVYVENEPASFMITSAAAFSADVPAKTDKDVTYPEDMGQDSTTFMQKYNETGTLRVNAANTTSNDLKDVNSLLTLPTKADGNDFSVQVDGSKIASMTIPAGATVLYSPNKVTDSQSIDTTADGFVTADNVTDWSTIQSVLVQSPTLASLKQTTVYLPIKVADYTAGQSSKPDTVTLDSTATEATANKSMNTQAKSTINLSVPKTTINVHYVNGTGTPLAATSTGQEAVGGTYSWTNPTVLGYHVTPSEPTSYTVTTSDGETKDIDVVYTPNDEPLTINYVNQQGTVFTTDHQTGQFGQTVNIDQKTFPGYTAQAGNPTTYTFTKDGTTNNVVTLYYIAQSKTITIHYVYADGSGTAAPDVPVSGIIGEAYSKTSPAITNCEPNQTTVSGTLATDSSDVTVTYTRDTAHADIIYVDDDNNEQIVPNATQHETGGAGATTDFNLIVPANYVMVTPATSTAITFLNDSATNNTADNVTIHLKHDTKTVTPSQPQVPGDKIPGTNVNWPIGTNADDLNRTVTETVQYVYAGGGKAAANQTQSVNFQRAAVVDDVTGDLLGYLPVNQITAYKADPTSVTLSPTDGWTVQSGNPDFTALTSPVGKPGYTADQATTQAYTITPATGNIKLTVTYTPDKQAAIVTYVDDDDNGATVHQDTLSGVSDGSQNYTKVLQAVQGGLIALGYQVVGTDLPANDVITFDHDDEAPQNYIVHLKHQTKVITPDKPQIPGNKVPNTNLTWPVGVNENDLNRTVTQTIQYVYSNGGKVVPDHQASVAFQRAAVMDQVTGKLLGYLTPDKVAAYKADPTSTTLSADNGWASTTPTAIFVAVTSPAGKAGYTPKVATTATYDVTPTTGNSKLTITYTPDSQQATVTYVDDDDNGTTVHQDNLTGVSDGSQNYTKVQQAVEGGLTSLGYQVVGSDLPANDVIPFDHDDTTPQNYTVHLKHQTKVVTPSQPQVPGDKIPGTNANWPAGADSAELNRTVTETVQYVYADGSKVAADRTQSVNFQRAAAVDAVTGDLLGYLPVSQLAAYEADPTSVTLSPTDAWTVQSGNPDFTALTSPAGKTGYTADKNATQAYTVTPSTGNIKLTVTYTPDDQQATVTYVDDDNNGTTVHQDNLTGVSDGSQNYTKVQQAVEGGLTALGYQVVDTDLPANDIITFDHDDTTPQNYTVHLKHLTRVVTPDQPQVPGNKVPNTNLTWPTGVNHNDLNRTVTQTIQYVYSNGGKVAADHASTVNFQRAAVVDQATGKLLGYLTPDKVTAYEADSTNVTLSADDGWASTTPTASFAAVTSPAGKSGYTADQAVTQAYTVTPSTGSIKLTVTYTPDDQQATVTYVDDDDNGTTIHQDNLSGVSDGSQNYTKVQQAVEGGLTALGYQVVDTDLPANDMITFDHDDTTPQNYTVHLKHQAKVVTPDQPQVPGNKVPNTNLTWPAGINKNDLNRTVTQTIQYVYSNGGKVAPDYEASVDFQRTAVVDQVTGKLLGYLTPDKVAAYEAEPTSVTLSADDGWVSTTPTASFAAVTSPAGKAGYTPKLATTAAYDVTPTTGDSKLTITYTPDSQKTTVTYVDDDANGATIHQDTVTGVTAGANNYTAVKEAIEGGLTAKGYTVISDDLPANGVITFGNQPGATPSYTVHLKHQTATFTPNHPDNPNNPIFSNNPNGPKWPDGATKDNLEKVVHETVNYVYAKDDSTAAPTVTDAVTYTRDGTVDLVTRGITYTDWSAKDYKTGFNAKSSPVINGYLADVAEVPEIGNVTPTTADIVKTITYSQLGSYITNLTNIPDIPYPNDPHHANQTTTPVIPYEPGYQPYGPDGTPLKPINPNDVTKGYLPPVPTNPLSNTPLTYQPVTVPGNDTPNTPNVPTTTDNDTQTPETPVTADNTPVVPAPAAKTQVPVSTGYSQTPKASGTENSSIRARNAVNNPTTAPTSTRFSANSGEATSATQAMNSQINGNKSKPSSQAAKQLPQTNEQSASWLSLLGLSFLGFLGLDKTRRRKND